MSIHSFSSMPYPHREPGLPGAPRVRIEAVQGSSLELAFDRRVLLLVLAFVLLVLAPSPLNAQESGRAGEALPQQRMGPNDLVEIGVYQAPELSLKTRIASDGKIRLPMLKHLLPAAGKLPAELEMAISEAYVSEGILVNPVVTVAVLDYASKPVSVIGSVEKPVTFHADQPITLLEAITRAGGLSEDAGSFLLLSSHAPGEGEDTVLTERIPIADLLESAGPTASIRLHGGEEIRVPEAGKIYVVGNVKRPGSYRIPNDHETTILKALALSEGLLPNATREAYIYRKSGNGEKVEIPINLRDLMARKTDDVTLLRDDVLYIPESSGRKATKSAMEKALAFGSATLSGVLIWGVARR